MAEYIEREALLQALEEVGGCDAPSDSWADGWDKGISEAIKFVKELPAADVVEVRHGTWIGEPSVTISANTCDFCKSNSARLHGDLLSVGYGVYIHIRFCPMCGRCIV